MTKIPYEIPAEIRDLTAKSVEDARKAFESFIEAAPKATAQAEGTANALQSTAKEVSAGHAPSGCQPGMCHRDARAAQSSQIATAVENVDPPTRRADAFLSVR